MRSQKPRRRRRSAAARLASLAAGLMIAAVAGCSTAAQYAPKPMQPASAARNIRIGPVVVRTPVEQLGVDVSFYVSAKELVAPKALQIVRYVKSLHANSLSISFPVYTTGPGGTMIKAGPRTPTPGQVGAFMQIANASGLYTVIRPLLDEHNLGTWRSAFVPANLAAWFTSYKHFLRPYLTVAQRDGVNDFSVGVELGPAFTYAAWTKFDKWAAGIFHRTLSFSADWHFYVKGELGGGSVASHQVDAYPGFKVTDNASVATLTTLWKNWIAGFPKKVRLRSAVFSEVGIAAEPGAYLNSAWWGNSTGPIKPYIQVRWYQAACNAVAQKHINGLYFWAISFGRPLDHPALLKDPGSFVAMPGAKTISTCFTRLS